MGALINDSQLSVVNGTMAEVMKYSEAETREMFLLFFVVAHSYASLCLTFQLFKRKL